MSEERIATLGGVIRTKYDPPPIPDWRLLAWHAWVDGQEELGTWNGATEQEAIDLLCEDLFDMGAAE